MKVLFRITIITFASLFAFVMPSYGEICGRIDAAPAYVRVDVLESGHTVKTLNMCAFRTDATIVLNKSWGLCIKPSFLYGKGQHGELGSGGAGIGFCCPFKECFSVTPYVGCTFTNLNTRINIPVPDFPDVVLKDVREKFTSSSPYLALELSYTFLKCWRICVTYQYSWSRTHTTLELPIGKMKFKSHSAGPTYSALIERDLNKHWSVNIGAAYNISLSKEKHGLRGMGVKFGTSYWF